MTVFPIIDFFAPDHVPNTWTSSHPRRLGVRISNEGSTVARSVSDESSYLIHNATVKDFKVARSDTGIGVADGASFSIVTDLVPYDNARVWVHLLEYDAQGVRGGEVRVRPRAAVHYVPKPGVSKFVLTARISGQGDVVVRELTVRQLDTGGAVPPGLHELTASEGSGAPVDQRVKALRRNLLSLEDASRRVGAQVTQMLTDLEEGAQLSGSAARLRREHSLTEDLVRDPLLEMARSLPVSNGSHYFSSRFPYRVAIISDEYMLNFYKDTFDRVRYVSPDQVEHVIDDGFDLLLYVTCWKGLGDEEWRGVKFRKEPAQALEALLEHSRTQRIPTVFQSIEDPSNFDYFLPIAEKFDYVFTSDTDSIDRYRQALGHDRVYYGEYGANPLLNNPIGNRRFTLNRAFFAGSYPKRYAARTADMETIFDSVLRVGPHLQIADRNAGSQEFAFPARFEPYCIPPIPHDLLQRVHKLFRYSLNFNSIKASPTMCAMRVYELQAQGRGVISNYARSVLNKFPEIRIVAHSEDLSTYFAGAPTEAENRSNEQLVRNVMTSHTSFDVVSGMLEVVGLDTHGITEVPTVTVFGDLTDPRVKASIARQRYPKIDSRDLSELEAAGSGGLRTGYFAVFDGDIEYGQHYLTDRVNAFKYVDVDFVTQSLVSGGDAESDIVHEYVAEVPDPRVTVYAFDRVIPEAPEALAAPSRRLKGYAVAPYEAKVSRRSEPNVDLVEPPVPVLSIIVPVYNNGRFLATKCLPSIMRNARWRQFEVILVDDGSSDPDTIETCQRLAEVHANVRVYFCNDGGSGSASRPRNLGVSLARSPLVSFLDPDNEISDGGYDTLVELYTEASADQPSLAFVSGYQVKVAEPPSVTGHHSNERISLITDTKNAFFRAGRFPVVSTQAAVMSKRVLEQAKLSFVEGAAGQDTLFGWELLLASDVAAFTGDVHLIYYAERTDSVTNVVGRRYFEKKLVMERAQVEALRGHGVLDSYIDHHLVNFVRGWYLEKLKKVAPADYDSSLSLIRQIVALYGADLDHIVGPDSTGTERA